MGNFRRFRAVVAFAALVFLAACTTWKPYTLAPHQQDLPDIVRVTLNTGEQKEIYEPELQGDSLLVGHDNRPKAVSVTRAVPLGRIQSIERQATNWAVVVPVAVVSGVALYAGMLWAGSSLCKSSGSHTIC